ncbi:melanoma-associated antigen 10-like [Hipposideros larvatus]
MATWAFPDICILGLQEPGGKGLRYVNPHHRAEEAQAVSAVQARGTPSPTSCPYSCGGLTRVIMPRAPKRRRYMLEDLDSTLRPLQVPQSACFPPSVTAVTPSTQLCQGCSSPEEKGSGTSQAVPDTGLSLRDAIDSMVATLVRFLLLKYHARELTTKAEMLSSVTKQHQDHFPEIFSKASECLQLVLGIDMKEVDSINHSYVLVNTLGLSYNGTLSDEHSMPKAGLLISVLGVIFIHGNCVSEEDLWEALSDMGVYPEREHFIYGEPRNLITKVWVQEQYLEYRQIPNSVPARYEFLWGLRAHAETSKMKILELLAKRRPWDPTGTRNEQDHY